MRRVVPAAVLFLICAPLFAGWRVIAWNDLGMHCTDGLDYSVFGVLPPYNTIHAQVIDDQGHLVRNGAPVRVTYEAVADPAGSINTTSIGKTNFWKYVTVMFGASPAPDAGLAGKIMPGSANLPQPMDFDATKSWFTAEGIPITPYDDRNAKNPYPMMRVVVRNTSGALLASTNAVLPVSDEMDCRACHGPSNAALGAPETKLDILRRHDALNAGSAAYASALSRAGFRSEGLVATVTGGTAILCAKCHSSNALPGTGYAGISSLSQAIHAHHATVTDPATGSSLGASTNRSACYRCHPGATTRCLRGAMGHAAQTAGQLAIQCQDCHGSMSDVGRAGRNAWLDEPTCQNCHTGDAVTNSGAIRFTDAFSSPGTLRKAANATFATNTDVPATGLSLFRFSTGHGGLLCEACHGSTHAEYPSSHVNDNVQSTAIQGHPGVIAECTACHASIPSTVNGGPHGMHPAGQQWVTQHGDVAEHGSSACQTCHGTDYRGTVLSRTFGDRTLSGFGGRVFWRGYQISCYACHNGPGSESATRVTAPSASDASAQTATSTVVSIPLQATDPAGSALTLHVVGPPQHGTAGIDGMRANYVPDPGFTGRDTFTYAAWNGALESSLATVTVDVVATPTNRQRAVRK